MDPYTDKLNATRQHYPFDNWRTHYQQELIRQWEPAGVEDTNAVQAIFDKLLANLIKLGEEASEKKKVKQIIKAIEATNDYAGLIMTEQREELCALTDEITSACGLDPSDYAEGAGLADEARDW
ncbi:MAG: hypothetical protein ACRYFX_05090 [Janthinobacterium lividum]